MSLEKTREALGGVLCFTALVAAGWYALEGRWVDVAVLLLAGLGQVLAFVWFRSALPRAVVSLVLLTAALSAAEQVYSAIWWWDLVMHCAALHALVWSWWNRVLTRGAPGTELTTARPPAAASSPALAATSASGKSCMPDRTEARASCAGSPPSDLRVRLGSRERVPSRPWQPFVLCGAVGLVIAVVWEGMELLGFLFVTPEIHIPPLDTLGDIVAGVLGAALVGFHRRPW